MLAWALPFCPLKRMAYSSCSLPFTPCDVGWKRLLSGDSTPAAAAASAAARGGDFLVAARGWGWVWAEDFFVSILGTDEKEEGEESC